ncbi:MAG: hypothetical protein S4CHLAM27_08400 [Chlamydiia bacterium]|nr:hypothetical protein [Chlamydiia bacterium]
MSEIRPNSEFVPVTNQGLEKMVEREITIEKRAPKKITDIAFCNIRPIAQLPSLKNRVTAG